MTERVVSPCELWELYPEGVNEPYGTGVIELMALLEVGTVKALATEELELDSSVFVGGEAPELLLALAVIVSVVW